LGCEVIVDEVAEMLESVEKNVVTLAKSGNATGKTHGAAMAGLWWYQCKSFPQVYTAAAPPESNLRNLLWGEIGSWVMRRPDLFEDSQFTTLSLQRRPKEFIKGVLIPVSGNPAEREARFSGKHAPNLLFIIDEGDAVPDEVYKGIESCMSGGNARLLVLFNPRNPSGRIYELQKRRLANVVTISAMTHPNVVTGDDVVPGAVTQTTTLRRIHEWTRPLLEGEPETEEDCFEVPEWLRGIPLKIGEHTFPPFDREVRKVDNPAFSYMVLARYPSGGYNQLVHRDWIIAARDRWDNYVLRHGERPPVRMCIAGQDVAGEGDDWNVQCHRYDNYVARLKRWQGVDSLVGAEIGAAHAKMANAEKVFVDGGGVGSSTAPKMRRMGVHAIAIKANMKPTATTEFGDFYGMRDQLLWLTREWLRTEDAMLPPEERLLEELAVPIYEITDLGKIRVMPTSEIKDVIGRSPDDLMALAHTFGPMRKMPLNKYRTVHQYRSKF
jgi:hypothetical protein